MKIYTAAEMREYEQMAVDKGISASPSPRFRTTSSLQILNAAPGPSCAPWGVPTMILLIKWESRMLPGFFYSCGGFNT